MVSRHNAKGLQMLITFHSEAAASITYFEDIAVRLLKMMGHSGTVPGALLAADIPSAFARLQQALAAPVPEQHKGPHDQAHAGDTDAALPVSLRLRAYPLIQMLSAAALHGNDVTWESGAPPG